MTTNRVFPARRDHYVTMPWGVTPWGAELLDPDTQSSLRLARWSDAITARSQEEQRAKAAAASLVILSSPFDYGFGHIMLDDMCAALMQ